MSSGPQLVLFEQELAKYRKWENNREDRPGGRYTEYIQRNGNKHGQSLRGQWRDTGEKARKKGKKDKGLG